MKHFLMGAAIVLECAHAQAQWNPESLSPYQPSQKVSGVIKNFGSDLAGLVKAWEAGFVKHHPGVRFEDKLPSSDAAIGGLVAGADVAPIGREAETTELLAFYETFNHEPLGIIVGTGAFDVIGRTWGEVIFVNKDNPLTRLTMKQLDGIFGSERTGGWDGFVWSPAAARGADENIRTWGQLGLEGEWANQPIHTYGYAPTGMTHFFQSKVFKGGNKWNPNYREYVETGRKQVPEGAAGESVTIRRMFAELTHDKYGIAWSGIPHARGVAGVKPLALSNDGRQYIEPTRENFQNRSYPLTRSIFIYLNRSPGKALDAKVDEFLHYILSRDGQQDVLRQGEYLPLTGEAAREELRKLQQPATAR